MTRTHTKAPVWTWKCDECGHEYLLGRSQRDLPSTSEMREAGWHIAKLFGDKCPVCVAKQTLRERDASETRTLFAHASKGHKPTGLD